MINQTQTQELSCFSQEVEEAFVGALFLDGGLVKEAAILPEQLYFPQLRLIYSAIRSLDEKGKPIDYVSMIDELGIDNLQWIGGVSYLNRLAGSVPTTANFPFYQQSVKEYAQKRKTIHIASRLIEQANGKDIRKTIHNGIQELMAIDDQLTDEDTGSITPSLVDLFMDCEKDLGEIVGIPSGFPTLDMLTGGFQESDLVIIGARPSMGKTAFALNVAHHAAKQDISLIFSLEMSKKQLLKRMAGFTGLIDSRKIKNPKKEFQEEDWQHFTDTIGALSQLNLHIFDKAGMDIPYIWSKVRKARREYGQEQRILVVIDYLQLIEGDRSFRQNRQAEINEISRALKTMARELNVTIIALSQLSRGVESRHDKHPVLSDLRESGQIEQDADLIAFLYRDDYYTKDSPYRNKIEIILAKHRNGPTGTIELGFQREYGLFTHLET
ncbi:replicative DNA helicase [Neobacillus sp. GCM10023253]|uniref:replicative DNA helicase n=1 Tax=Neobacillus sp. GCM10023253 TaxID=3252644 RepID=UPI003617D795